MTRLENGVTTRPNTDRKSLCNFQFPPPNIADRLEGYARFIFNRIAFSKHSPCAVVKNGRFLPRGDMTLVGLREHAEGESVLSVSLADKKTGHTKSACFTLDERYFVPAVGQGCRLLSTVEQEGLFGLIELCPYQAVRIWIFFPKPIPVAEALSQVRMLKKRSFLSKQGKIFPTESGDDSFLVLPPHPDPETGKWSLVLTLPEAEALLDGMPYDKPGPIWKDLVPPPEMNEEDDVDDTLMEYLSDSCSDGWSDLRKRSPHPELHKEEGSQETIAQGARERTSARSNLDRFDDEGPLEGIRRTQPIRPMSNLVPSVIGRLLDNSPMAIPTPSGVLNDVLNGGWSVGQVHLLVGPSGEGKSTFCGWTSDFSANNNIPVLYVSFQNTCQQLAMFALARTAQINSAQIVGRKWMDPNYEEAAVLSKSIIGAGRNYFRTGDHLQILDPEGPLETNRLEDAIRETRSLAQLSENDPILVIIDSIREVIPQRSTRSRNESGKQSIIPQAMMELKQIATRNQAAVITTLDVRSNNLNRLQWTHSSNVENESDYLLVTPFADVVLLLESRETRLVSQSTNDTQDRTEEHRLLDPLDHLLEESGHHPLLAKRIQEIRKSYPLLPEASSTYCRLAVLKNRAGRTETHPVFRYDRAFHDFDSIPLDNHKVLMEAIRSLGEEEDRDDAASGN
ncbi:MAG: hypothetical protein H6751_01375 [Candidatus Omnitrophica bacterium]|nr:hypothetical protein [Candidatus Omnitrophota bacterium]MCB9781602.1 hypothetical protein [Candidatus Omnitrophota bacterium]